MKKRILYIILGLILLSVKGVGQVIFTSNKNKICAGDRTLKIMLQNTGNTPLFFYIEYADKGQNSFTPIIVSKPHLRLTNNVLFESTPLIFTSKDFRVIYSTDTVSDGSLLAPTTSSLITIEVNPNTSITTQPSGYSVCYGDVSRQLNVDASGTGSITYQWFSNSKNSNSGGVLIESATNATFRPSENIGTYYYYVEAKSSCLPVSSNAVEVKINALPAAPTVADKEYCKDEITPALTAGVLVNHTLGWYGTNPSGGISTPAAPTPLTSTIGSSTYYVSQTNTANSCESPRAFININVKALPATPSISSNSPICEDDVLKLNTAQIAGAIYYWEGSNSFISSSSSPEIIKAKPANEGSYTLKIKFDGCMSLVSSPITVVVNPLPAAPIVYSNSPIDEGATLKLSAQNVTGGTFNWTGPNAFTSTDQNPILPFSNISMSGTFAARVTIGICNSPPSFLMVLINPLSKFLVPNAFVPGSASEYDNKFRIFVTGSFDINTFKDLCIYNRAGQLIKKLNLITDTWDGRGADGNLLESDVYIWVARFNIEPSTRTGTFILLK